MELFALGNLGFLAVDIYVAHSVNQFHHWAEWVPFAFSLAAPLPLLLGLLVVRWRRAIGLTVGLGAVVVGIAGLLLHLDSQFFEQMTIASLVYTAPFVAPLAYTGLGLLLIMNRLVPPRSVEWAGWVLLLAMGGFVGNFVLALADHAQNGFFNPLEWVSVVAAAIGVGALAPPLLVRVGRTYLAMAAGAMVFEVAVGLLGFVLHARAILHSPMATWFERVVYSAPAFAPLLFANLAILAMIGLWAAARQVQPSGQVNVATA